MTALGACIAWGGERGDAAACRGGLRLGLLARRSRSATRSRASPRCSPGSAWSRSLRWGWRGAVAAAAPRRRRPGRAGDRRRDADQRHRERTAASTAATSGDLRRGRPRLAAGPADRRLGLGLVRPRVLRADRAGADDRLALRADHRRRRAGGDRPDRSTSALLVARWSCCSARRARPSLARTAVAACFVAMIVDSLGYTGFAIDPATWALLALGVALAGRRASRPARLGRRIRQPDVRLPAPPGDHRRRLHGLERRSRS